MVSIVDFHVLIQYPCFQFRLRNTVPFNCPWLLTTQLEYCLYTFFFCFDKWYCCCALGKVAEINFSSVHWIFVFFIMKRFLGLIYFFFVIRGDRLPRVLPLSLSEIWKFLMKPTNRMVHDRNIISKKDCVIG